LDTLNFLGLLTLELNDRLNILILDQTEKIQEVIKVAYIDQYSVDKESQSIYRSTNYIYIYIYIYIVAYIEQIVGIHVVKILFFSKQIEKDLQGFKMLKNGWIS
jgi:hypothetical protein